MGKNEIICSILAEAFTSRYCQWQRINKFNRIMKTIHVLYKTLFKKAIRETLIFKKKHNWNQFSRYVIFFLNL